MKKKLIFSMIVGIGAIAFYSFLLDAAFLRKAVSLWYMEDSKGMQMLLVSKGSSAHFLCLFLVMLESLISPIHSLLMFQVVIDLYGTVVGSLYFVGGIVLIGLPIYLVSKRLLIVKFEPILLFIFFSISWFILPVPTVALFAALFVKSQPHSFLGAVFDRLKK